MWEEGIMKRKLSLFLVLCLLTGTVSPVARVQATEVSEPVVQIEGTTKEFAVEGIKDAEKAVEEKIQIEDEILITENLILEGGEVSGKEELADENMQVQEEITRELTREDIPDEVLWTYLLNEYGEEGVLTTNDLSGIASLDIGNSIGEIKDLKGIEYAKELETCELYYHCVTDEGILPLLTCTKLTRIDLRGNELRTMPDFSKLINLKDLELDDNFIPIEEMTSDKCPEGIDVAELRKQTQYLNWKIEVVDGIYKDDSENGTYGISFEITGGKGGSDSLDIRITDITDGESDVLYEDKGVSCEYNYDYISEIPAHVYIHSINISGITAVEGIRTWEVVCIINGEKITEVLKVTVDPNGVGGFQTVPESILPKALSDYWTGRSEYGYDYDENGDGKISFIEIGKISDLSIAKWDQLNLTSYKFLPYMKNLQYLDLQGEKNFNQESLELLASLKNLWQIRLENVGIINDISSLKNLSELKFLKIHGSAEVTGLSELDVNQISRIEVDEGTFSDEEIFQFIQNRTEVNMKVGSTEILVSEIISMQSVEQVQVSVSTEDVIVYDKKNPFVIGGAKSGEADITYTYGEYSYMVHVTVNGEEWDADPELGTIVEESDRMHFTGTEGVENARVSRSMVDGEGNIWNISTRTPEKILESDGYTKYAARILYARTNRFSVETNTANADFSFYLDTEGNLWVYNQGNEVNNYNFKARYKVMSGVVDWQEGGYSEEAYYPWLTYHSDKKYESILIMRQDGSLWYCSFDGKYDAFDGDDYYFSVTGLRPRQLEKLEDSGVTGVYPNSYLKNGNLYRVSAEGSKTLIAKNITKVWDNTVVVLAQNATGNYYSLRNPDEGKLKITGTVKEFLVGSYWDSGNIEDFNYTEEDIIAGYLLMDNGTLYRTKLSRDIEICNFELLDTDVTDLEKDYYWKNDTAYWFTGEIYADYIGPGKGIYPVREKEETTGGKSQTLYVNGVKYLTKVWDWTVADQCIYAVRLDNTLWQFDDDHLPKQVDMSALSSELKDIKVREKDIDILDLKETNGNVTVKWTPVEGAASYQVDTSSSDNDNWSITNITETEYVFTPNNSAECWYKIQAVDVAGKVIAQSWKFNTKLEESKVEGMYFQLWDSEGKEIDEKNEMGEYLLTYSEELKGRTLYLDVTLVGKEDGEIKAVSSDSSVVETIVNGQSVELKVNGSGKTYVTVTEQESGYEESICLYLKDYMPKPVSSNVEINRKLSDQVSVDIELPDSTHLEKVKLDTEELTEEEIKADYANYFSVNITRTGQWYAVNVVLDDSKRSSRLPKGTYRLPLKVRIVDAGRGDNFGSYLIMENIPLNLNVVLSDSEATGNEKVSVSVSLAEKLNLFYTNTTAVYKLTPSSGEITNAEFVPLEGKPSYFESKYDSQSGELRVVPNTAFWELKSKALNNALKGMVKVTVGKTTWTKNVTIAINTVKPKVTLNKTSGKVYKFKNGSEDVYAGTIITFKPIDKKTKQSIENVTMTLTGYETTKKGITTKNFSPGWNVDGGEKDYTLVPNEQGEYTIHFVGKANATATLKVQGEYWSEPIYVKYKTSVTSQKMIGKLSATKITLNKTYAGDKKTLTLTTNLPYTDFSLGSWKVTKLPKGAASSEAITVSSNDSGLSFALKEESKADLKKGNYTVSIPVTFYFADGSSYTPKALKVNVNVLDESITTKNIKWKASGKLDVIDRENSAVTITPTISKLNGEVAEVHFSTEDREAGLDSKVNLTVEDGKIKVSLKTGVAVSTKEKFEIHPQVVVRTETGNLFTIKGGSKITLKPVQSKVQMAPVQKSLTMKQGTAGEQLLNYTLKGVIGAKVERVETTTKGFEVSLLEEGVIQVSMLDSGLKAKAYAVKVKVYLKDQAMNMKPVTMNVKVVVKK